MPQTRTQSGKTPRKTAFPDFVETPGRKTRGRKSLAADLRSDSEDAADSSPDFKDTIEVDQDEIQPVRQRKSKKATEINGVAKRTANGDAKKPKYVDGWAEGLDPKKDYSGEFEFGGSMGAMALMIGFPLLMYYMWVGATYFDGKPPVPGPGEKFVDFVKRMANLVYTGAFPHAKAWAMYWGFFVTQGLFYVYLPGVYRKGKPLPHEGGKKLDYYCSGLWSWWTTIVLMAAFHFTGIFKLYTIIDEFGPLMSVSIISGFLMSFYFYFSAMIRGKQHRMTGYPIYDFFMGAELNPRLGKWLDFKMFFEVRIPWYLLFLVSAATAARQYEEYGYVSLEVGLLCMAHWLYANACAKAEECIVPTWDMYYEKLGFMLAFWNLSGVPLSYCHAAVYLANHDPSNYRWPKVVMIIWYIAYLLVYYIWDTTQSQKSRFRARETGDDYTRKSFPQLPWQVVENPRVINSPAGTIMADGWVGKARKIHYTCDLFFALTWALVTGFNSPFPWFYPVFFSAMILHRTARDVHRCRNKYGEAWAEYERLVPYLYIPYVF